MRCTSFGICLGAPRGIASVGGWMGTENACECIPMMHSRHPAWRTRIYCNRATADICHVKKAQDSARISVSRFTVRSTSSQAPRNLMLHRTNYWFIDSQTFLHISEIHTAVKPFSRFVSLQEFILIAKLGMICMYKLWLSGLRGACSTHFCPVKRHGVVVNY